MLLKDLFEMFRKYRSPNQSLSVQPYVQEVTETSPLLDYDMNFREPLVDSQV